MLRVYTRHYPPCSQTDSNYRRCRCPKWINGTLPTGQFIRISAQTRSWESEERKARLMEFSPTRFDLLLLNQTAESGLRRRLKIFWPTKKREN